MNRSNPGCWSRAFPAVLCVASLVWWSGVSSADEKPEPRPLDEVEVATAKVQLSRAKVELEKTQAVLHAAERERAVAELLQATRFISEEEFDAIQSRSQEAGVQVKRAQIEVKLAEVAVADAEERARHNRAVGEARAKRAQLILEQTVVARGGAEKALEAAKKVYNEAQKNVVRGVIPQVEFEAVAARFKLAILAVKSAKEEEERATLALEKARLWLRFRSGPPTENK